MQSDIARRQVPLAPQPAPAPGRTLAAAAAARGKAQQSPATPPGAPGQGGGGRDGKTNSPERAERRSLLPSSGHQQRLIFVGKPFLCRLSREWMRETRRPELAQTAPISTRFSRTRCFNWFS